MTMSKKIVLIREEKTPSDSRVVLTPDQCKALIDKGYNISVQKSEIRAFKDDEYKALGVPVIEEIHDQDVFIGVKEVPISNLVPQKTYFFFSHTIKEQPYNRRLLQTAIKRDIQLIDYEVITNSKGQRLIAFGKFAGMVGAHNGLWTYGKRTGEFELPRMYQTKDYATIKEGYQSLKLPNIKIALTGTGRVANGAALVLDDMNIQKVNALDFVTKNFDTPVYTQLNSFYYAARKDGKVFDSAMDFYKNPKDYKSDFSHFLNHSDIFINGIYWDNDAPAFFTKDDMKSKDFNIKVIADVTCDIAPVSSIPSTLKASTIPDPVFGYNPDTEKEDHPFQDNVVDMMTIDNLPNELPRDASQAFGEMFIEHVLPELGKAESDIIKRATLCKDGALGAHFNYLSDYVGEI